MENNKPYTVFMSILAIISIALVIMDYTSFINIEARPFIYIDNGILIVFAIDYFVQLVKSEKKWQFIKTHIFDLLAIIPFNAIFSFFRVTRLFKLARFTKLFKTIKFVRIISLTAKFEKSAKRFLKTHGLIYLLIICTIILIISSVFYSLAENVSLSNSFWWAVTTATTVGYGDISPRTAVGRFSATLLMFVGIGLIGAITSSITTFFTQNREYEKKDEILEKLNQIEHENTKLRVEISRLNSRLEKDDTDLSE